MNKGLTSEDIDKINDLFKRLSEALEKLAEDLIKVFEKIINNMDMVKYKKFIKHKKRVRNRNKLYVKRKHKYGK